MGDPNHRPTDDEGSRRGRFESTLRARMAEVLGANPWIAAVEVDRGALRTAGDLLDAGATRVMAVGARAGVGTTEPDQTIPMLSLDAPSSGSMVKDIRSAHHYLANPSPEVQAQIDRWDPDSEAKAIGGLTVTAGTLLGRPTFGARPTSWLDLEDKLAIEPLWARAGVPTAPSAQVALADRDRLLAEHARLATDLGTMWAGDNSEGWHGGGYGTHWARTDDAAGRLADELDYERVRIMPFVDGVPCSIHGVVLPLESATEDNPDAVAVMRPCEMMMLRDLSADRLVYARIATHWDPAPADRAVMVDTARRIGAELRRTVGYRGVYTVDGVMGADGFRPTEVNTRYGAALASKVDTIEGPPLDLFLIHLCLVEGVLDDIDLRPLEAWALAHLETNRRVVAFMDTARAPEDKRSGVISRTAEGHLQLRSTDPAEETLGPEPVVATVDWDATASGGLLIFNGGSGVPTGPPTAPLIVELTELVDRVWQVDAPRLSAPTAAR